MNKKNIAVIASRLKCVDAISVEAEKWVDRYCKLGYNVHLMAGKFGEPTELPHFELPEMDYKHPEVRGIKRIVFSSNLDKQGNKAADILLDRLVKRIKGPLKNYLITNKIEILSVEDALASFKNLPLSVALSEIVKELGIPTISRYHYLPWQNPYFTKFDNIPKVMQNTPPKLKNVVHIVTTESAREKLFADRGIHAKVIPNTIDIDKVHKIDDYNKDFRKELGIRDDQLIFLQPTRIKRNKYVERSIKLVAELNDIMKKDNVLLITGSPVYTRGNYFEEIIKKIDKQKVQVIFANDRIFLGRHQNAEQKFYSIHDAYANADIVLYPNTGDGFGNPIIEAAAYRKPLIVNSFPNLKGFIEKGFKFVVTDQKVDTEVVSDAYEMIVNKEKTGEIADSNFELLKKHYSADVLDEALMPILNSLEREESLISKFAGFLPKTLWHRDRNNKPDGMKKQFNEKRHFDKKNDKRPDLKNKKGSYKEPKK